jgi:hypothetical protein
MINDQPPIPPLRQLYDERCAGGLAVTACYTTKWDVIAPRIDLLSDLSFQRALWLNFWKKHFAAIGFTRKASRG